MEDEEIYSFTEVELYNGELFITFGNNQSARMELKDSVEEETVKMLLESNDFWAQFLGSLSAALGRHR